MDRRWFLGAIGSVMGTLVGTAVVGKAAKVEIAKPTILTEDGPQLLLHQMGLMPPKNGEAGYAHGCIWESINGGRPSASGLCESRVPGCLINVGTRHSARWVKAPGDPEKFVKMVLGQTAARRANLLEV